MQFLCTQELQANSERTFLLNLIAFNTGIVFMHNSFSNYWKYIIYEAYFKHQNMKELEPNPKVNGMGSPPRS